LINVEANKIDIAKVKSTLGLIKKNVDPVIYRSINKTIGTNRTLSIQKVYDYLNLTKTYIRNRFKNKGGRWLENKARSGHLQGQYWSSGGPVGFINFQNTSELKGGKGVSVKILRQGSREYFRHAFIAELKTKDDRSVKNVFERAPSQRGGRAFVKSRAYAAFMKSQYGKRWRLPVHRLAGPRIQDILAENTISKQIETHAVETLQKNIDSQLAYELSKI
jgi:hypothetical protein